MKRSRQKAILTLLSQRRITTQKQLCDALLEQGFRVTQATLSRDIAELGLTKSENGYGLPRVSTNEMADAKASKSCPKPSARSTAQKTSSLSRHSPEWAAPPAPPSTICTFRRWSVPSPVTTRSSSSCAARRRRWCCASGCWSCSGNRFQGSCGRNAEISAHREYCRHQASGPVSRTRLQRLHRPDRRGQEHHP